MRVTRVLAIVMLMGLPWGVVPTCANEPELDRFDLTVPTLPSDRPMFLEEFSTELTDFGTGKNPKKEKAQELAKMMKEIAPHTFSEAFVTHLTEAGSFPSVSLIGSGTLPEGALLVKGNFTVLNPGSRAKRYLVGMGAGKSKICVSGRIVDSTGKEFGTFDHCRSGALGWFGGRAEGMMSTDVYQTAIRLADFVVAWTQGTLPQHRD